MKEDKDAGRGKRVRLCLGFGATNGRCTREAGSLFASGKVRSPYWCQECDDARIAHIDKQLRSLEARLDAPTSEQQSPTPETGTK